MPAVHGTGADIIHHTGVHGATAHGITTHGTAVHGHSVSVIMVVCMDIMTHGTTEAGTDGTGDGISDGIMAGITAVTIHGTITTITDGTTRHITTARHMDLVTSLPDPEDTRTDIPLQEPIQTAHRSEGTTPGSKAAKAYQRQEPQPQRAEVSEQAAA